MVGENTDLIAALTFISAQVDTSQTNPTPPVNVDDVLREYRLIRASGCQPTPTLPIPLSRLKPEHKIVS